MENHEKHTLLFVDDEESILDIANEFFQNKGYRVKTANNGRAATKILGEERIDCCFTDINMPEMDGLQLAEYIRKVDNTLPVIIMTGYPSLDNTIKTLKNGVVDFLIKPVNLNQMELSVRRVLRERELFVRNLILTKKAESAAKLKKLNNELLYKVEELNTLNRIMSDFASISNSSDVFERVVNLSLHLTHADEARFFVINEAIKDPVEVTRAMSQGNGGNGNSGNGNGNYGTGGNGNGVLKNPPCDGPSGQDDPLLTSIQEMIQNNIQDENPLLISENHRNGMLHSDICSFMLVPLTIRSKIFGMLAVSIVSGDIRFTEKDLYYLSFMTNKAAYAIENLALYENIYDNLFATLYAFVRAIEARDPYTEQHSNRVTSIAVAISREMGCSQEDQDILNVAGRLHDIGKIGIRDEILLKPGRLTAEEYGIIKEHPQIGASIVAQMGLWDREKKIIRAHHERWDGTGYPDGLVGEEIPLLARILSVADVYDAIASDRAYRNKMVESKILSIMYGGAGSQFAPEVIDIFRGLYEQGTIQAISAE